MQATKRSEVNLRKPLHMCNNAGNHPDPPCLGNPEEISPEVQNRGISGPTKGLMSSKNFKRKPSFEGYKCTIYPGQWSCAYKKFHK